MTDRRAANPLPSDLLVVTDRHQAVRPLLEIATSLLGAGVRWLWLRDRDLPAEQRRGLAKALATATQRTGAVLSIGANVELATSLERAGVHLRKVAEVEAARHRLGPSRLVGVSAHSLADVGEAAEAGADYVTLSPIFVSGSKPGYGPALGVAALSEAGTLGIPVLALGGVTPDNARFCIEAGAAGVAVMGPLMRAEHPGMLVRTFPSLAAGRHVRTLS